MAQQQQPGLPQPRIDTIFPLGAKAGTSVAELTVTGGDLDDLEALLFNHPGIKAELIAEPAPKTDPKKDKKKKDAPRRRRGQGKPSPSKFKVTVAGNVPPGNYDLRVVNKHGVSNPRTFVVGDLNEVNEKEPNNDVPQAMKIEVNTTVNGVISNPTDVDLFLLSAKKGQRIVLACLAESIDSKARPLVEVYEPSGRRIVGHSGPDAVTDFVAPNDGDFYIRSCRVHLHGRRSPVFLSPDGDDQPVDRLGVSANGRAGQAGPAHALRPQSARRHSGTGSDGRRPAPRTTVGDGQSARRPDAVDVSRTHRAAAGGNRRF